MTRIPSQRALVRDGRTPQIAVMDPRIFDFSHLSPAERIELAGQLWDSLEPEPLAASETLATELRQRRTELRADGDLGIDGNQVLDEIAARNG